MQFLVALGASFQMGFLAYFCGLFSEGVPREMFTEMFFSFVLIEVSPSKVNAGSLFFSQREFWEVKSQPYLIIRMLDYMPEQQQQREHT